MFLYAEDMNKFAFSSQFTDNHDDGFAIMGVAFDSTTSYKSGSRYGPNAVREASYNFESFNLRFNKTLTVNSYDIGNIQVNHGNYENTHLMIKDTVKSILDENLKPIVIGGEHTISNGVLSAIKEYDEELFSQLTIIHLDAHFDMRDEYLGEKYSHATVLRRIHNLQPKEIIQIGIRSAQFDEYEYVKRQDNISYYTNRDYHRNNKKVLDKLRNINTPIYMTVDIDVLDPAYAPSVGTPAPCGLNPYDLEDIVEALTDKNLIGLDVVEVASDKIGDSTSINAAKLIYDYLTINSR